MPNEKNGPMVFCDFDGTITAIETFSGMLRRFTPDLFSEIGAKMYAREITVKEGVTRLLSTIPSSEYPNILDFVREQPLRPGLEELLDFLASKGVPFLVVSGGLRGMVLAGLGPLIEKVEAVHAPDVDTSGPFLRVIMEMESDTETLAKAEIVKMHEPAESVAIGDGITDLNLSLNSDLVFARKHLAKFLDDRGVTYQPWDDFHDVRRYLTDHWSAL